MSGSRAKKNRKLMKNAGIPADVADWNWWRSFLSEVPPGTDLETKWWKRTITLYAKTGRTRGKRTDRDWRAQVVAAQRKGATSEAPRATQTRREPLGLGMSLLVMGAT